MSADFVRANFFDLKAFGAEAIAASAEMVIASRVVEDEVAAGVAEHARTLASSEGSTAALAGRDIRVLGSRIIYGGSGYDMGAEYGASAYRQFKRYNAGGYFLGKAEEETEIETTWDEIVWAAIKTALHV